MAEASRIAFMAAERQKGDFVGSISHELRSPLHGILASVEFLADTEFDPFQNNLVDTISSCGRTLLDTVNHILDYSKMNAYEKNWLTAKKSRAQKSTVAIKSRAAVVNHVDKDAPPLMNIYATTDVAAIAEEVVEGVYAGQIFQDSEWFYTSHCPLNTSLTSNVTITNLSPSAKYSTRFCFTTQVNLLRSVKGQRAMVLLPI